VIKTGSSAFAFHNNIAAYIHYYRLHLAGSHGCIGRFVDDITFNE
jgi:hypothetical protein